MTCLQKACVQNFASYIPRGWGLPEDPVELMDFGVDSDTKLLDNVPQLGGSDSIENVFLILGHPMLDHLSQIKDPTTKEIVLCQ